MPTTLVQGYRVVVESVAEGKSHRAAIDTAYQKGAAAINAPDVVKMGAR